MGQISTFAWTNLDFANILSRVQNGLVDRNSLRLVLRAMENFRVVIINGPRQSGKSTLLEMVESAFGGTRITLDDRDSLRAARSDPAGLAVDSVHPLMIDEVQRGGDPLVLAIKADVDRNGRSMGRYVLAGSSRFLTVPTLSESLAGRARIIDLWPFSQAELSSNEPHFIDNLFAGPAELRATTPAVATRRSVVERIVRGGFPAVQSIALERDRTDWFEDYKRTLIQRDVAELRTPRRNVDLGRIVRLVALRTSGELVVATLASDLGLSADTIKDYLGLLESIYLHHLVPAWTPGGTGRVVHRPKIHMVDSGLACHLHGVGADELSKPGTAKLGPLLESFVVGEVQRQIPWSELRPSLHHFRDKAQREVDLVLEARDGRVAAIEVKAARDVGEHDFAHLEWLRDKLGNRFVQGVILHLGDRVTPVGDRLTSMPVAALWGPG